MINLEKILGTHCRNKFDNVLTNLNYRYTRDGKVFVGEIDALVIYNPLTYFVYEAKSTYSNKYRNKAISQLYRARDYIREINDDIRVRGIYITRNKVERIF